MNAVIDNISNHFIHKIDQGVTIDLNDFLEANDLVKNYEIRTTEDDKYIVTVELFEFTQSKVKDVFFRLLRFMCYETAFYTQEINPEDITYYLLSMDLKNNLGFHFSLIFYQG